MRFVFLLLLCFNLPAANADGFLDRLSSIGGSKQPSFLPPDKAFGLEVTVRDAHTLQANFRITPGYYLYREKITFVPQGSDIKVKSVVTP